MPLPARGRMMFVTAATRRIRWVPKSAMKTVSAPATAPLNAIAGSGADDVRHRIHAADPLVAEVGDEDVAGAVHGHTCRHVQAGGDGRAALTAETWHAAAAPGGDDA